MSDKEKPITSSTMIAFRLKIEMELNKKLRKMIEDSQEVYDPRSIEYALDYLRITSMI